MVKWLRRRLITGFFVTVPLVASVVALVWVVRALDRVTRALPAGLLGRYVPGGETIPGLGIVLTAVMVLLVGTLATNMLGRRFLAQGEAWLLHVPVFRTIYGPLKQLTEAFSPDNVSGFKRVVLVRQAPQGWMLGFLTKDFVVDRADGPEHLLAVYIPTNHLYLGTVVICAPGQVSYPDLTIEQGISIFLTGGMALPPHVVAHDDVSTAPRPDGIRKS